MEEKDLLIDGGLEKISKMLGELEEMKPGIYAFETNCRYESSKGTVNIKTVTKAEDLVHLLVELNVFLIGYERTKEDLGGECLVEGEIKIGGFTIDQWKSDISYLIKKLLWKERVESLKQKKAKLEALYSQGRKDNISIDNILKSL